VHYEDREYSQKFVDLNGRGLLHKRYSKVQNFIHEKQMRMILDDDPDWYYLGRFSVEEPGPKSYRNVLEISAVLRPYKYAINSTLEDWLWDPFSFEEGVIREYKDIFVDTAEDITVIGSEMPVVPTIIVVSENGDGMDLTYKGTRYHLADGRNRIVTMVITANESVFHFEGLGFVSIDFREGSL
jgi:phage-related protein